MYNYLRQLKTRNLISKINFLILRDVSNFNKIREKCKDLVLTQPQIREIMKLLLYELNCGLSKKTHDKAIVKCFITYVQDLPNGKEKGKYLALDLGGTNFRTLLTEIHGMKIEAKSKTYTIPVDVRICKKSDEQLFDYIVACLANFLKEQNVDKISLPLGFTFSFPLIHKGLTKGILVSWTKGFNCPGLVGEDVVILLKDAIKRRGDLKVDVKAIINDTTGTLMSCAHKDQKCRIGVILGTGCNACYVEKVSNAELFNEKTNKPYVIINAEWGAFGIDGKLDFVRTPYDRNIDEHSINRGKQFFEKMIAGMYLGEIVRLCLVKLTKDGLLFGGKVNQHLETRERFLANFISEIEADKKGDFTNCRKVLNDFNLHEVTDQDCEGVRYVCECVSRRSAHLVSAGIATLINKIGEKSVTVGIDGSLYQLHPHFHKLMMEKIGELVTPGIKFNLKLSEDGSGIGAALVVAAVSK